MCKNYNKSIRVCHKYFDSNNDFSEISIPLKKLKYTKGKRK